MDSLSFQFLGQSGILLYSGSAIVAIDPYLSNSVCERFGREFDRQVPAPLLPGNFDAVRWICLTHAHLDHTDPATLVPMAVAAPQAVFLAPPEAAEILVSSGISESRIRLADEHWTFLAPELAVRAVPAAHLDIERDANGRLRYCGYLFRIGTALVYHAGDTMPHADIVSALLTEGELEIAFLPCNERNVYRERAGIIGNMSVREMLAFASELRAKRVAALHWDMFAPNSATPEEIMAVVKHEKPSLTLLVPRCGAKYDFELKEIA